MTSANVTHYTIFGPDGKKVGEHQQHCLCKTHWERLLVFQPLAKHTIQPWGYDEEEEYWEAEPINLRDFLNKVSVKIFCVLPRYEQTNQT